MRISNLSIYANATTQLNSLQSALARTQMQLSTNRRILSPSDDPVASARVLEVSQSQQMNAQFATNRTAARSALALTEGALQNASNLMLDIQNLAVKAGNGSLMASDRAAIATELEGKLEDLFGVANSTDGTGGYLFSGYKATTQPFSRTPEGAHYQGDQGQRQLQVGASRRIPLSVSGNEVFGGNLTGNGSFQTLAALANTGTGVISSGTVVDFQKLPKGDYAYSVSFSIAGAPPATSFTINDTSTDPPSPLPGQSDLPFTPGQAIEFEGMRFEIAGAPADGDAFSVTPSAKESVFTTVTDLIGALRAPATDEAGQAALKNGVNRALDNLSAAHEKVLTVRASVGAHMKEIDYLDSAGDDLDVQYQSTLSDLQDLDVVKAISDFSQQQTTLQAAQMSFKTMSGLSLFNYL